MCIVLINVIITHCHYFLLWFSLNTWKKKLLSMEIPTVDNLCSWKPFVLNKPIWLQNNFLRRLLSKPLRSLQVQKKNQNKKNPTSSLWIREIVSCRRVEHCLSSGHHTQLAVQKNSQSVGSRLFSFYKKHHISTVSNHINWSLTTFITRLKYVCTRQEDSGCHVNVKIRF